MTDRRRSSSGFTLLEVLAAVAILGIWYVILAAVAIQGLRAQGESYRRLEASFLADEAIADLEAGLTSGRAPKEDTQEYERDDYSIKIEVLPYALDVPELEASTGDSRSEPLELAGAGVTNLLGGAGASGESPLRSVHVEVTWPEGNDERSVIRETYAFDLESVRPELAALEETLVEAAGEDTGAAGSSDDDPLAPPREATQ
jgi:prepilin-type N-terminal cleavage/methylation domain-containing protein